ncbi:MAG: hypothetical protein HYT48_00465 [Candidatus Vogelbacteria bacterium]|nr:hypothetical protein [Candidatus Vogelbacteria bacterium]
MEREELEKLLAHVPSLIQKLEALNAEVNQICDDTRSARSEPATREILAVVGPLQVYTLQSMAKLKQAKKDLEVALKPFEVLA